MDRVSRRVAAPVGLLVLYLAVQWLYLRPPSSQDGMQYFERAADFPDLAGDHWGLRVGVLLPVRFAQWIFGYSEVAYYAFPLVAGALLILATYWFGWQLFSPAVGVGAALVVLLSTLFLEVSSILLPDVATTALFTAAIALLVFVARTAAPWARRQHARLVAVGLLLAWAYLVREFIVLVFPVVAVVFWAYRIPWRQLTWIAAPAAAVFVVESVFNWISYGSPIERLTVTGSHDGFRSYITDSRLDAVLRLPRELLDFPGGWVLVVLLIALPLSVFLKWRPSVVPVAWVSMFWLLLTLGSGLVIPDFRFLDASLLRYWLPIVPPLAVAAVAVLHRGLVHVREAIPGAPSWLAGAATVVVVAGSMVVAGRGDRASDLYRVNGADQLAEVRDWLEAEGQDVDVIWTDTYTARLLPLYSRTPFGRRIWDGEIRSFDDGEDTIDLDEIDEGIVVYYRPGARILVPRAVTIEGRLDGAPNLEDEIIRRDDGSLVIYRVG